MFIFVVCAENYQKIAKKGKMNNRFLQEIQILDQNYADQMGEIDQLAEFEVQLILGNFHSNIKLLAEKLIPLKKKVYPSPPPPKKKKRSYFGREGKGQLSRFLN